MFYTIYKVTNTVNGKIYVGKHQTENMDDGYLGSGKAIKDAVKKYGRDHFTKEILHVFETEAEMNAKEKELITEEFVLRSDTYNLGVGGEGGPHFKGRKHKKDSLEKRSENRRDVVYTDESRRKISESNRRRTVSDETRRKLSDKALLRNRKSKSASNIVTKQKYVMTEEHKSKISASLKQIGVVSRNVIEYVVCPHCLKEGQRLAMLRHHFTNCKLLREGQDG